MSVLGRGLDRITARRVTRWLERIGEGAALRDMIELRLQRSAVRKVQRKAQETADRIELAAMTNHQHIVIPAGSDWVWRPQLWTMPTQTDTTVVRGGVLTFSAQTAVFTDAGDNRVIARQIFDSTAEGRMVRGLKIEVFDFAGKYLSVVLDLPPSATRGLTLKHHIALTLLMTAETDLQCYAVLNVDNGPNKHRLVHGFRPSSESQTMTFDLTGTNVDPERIERLWLEIITEPVGMNAIHLRDFRLSRSLKREI